MEWFMLEEKIFVLKIKFINKFGILPLPNLQVLNNKQNQQDMEINKF